MSDYGKRTLTSASAGRMVSGRLGAKNTVSRIDAEGASGQLSQIDIGGASNATTYEVQVQTEGLDSLFTVLTDGSATTEKLRDLVFDAIDADPILRGKAASVAVGTDLVLITWKVRTSLVAVTFPTNPSSHLGLTNTAAVAAPQYLYGYVAENLGRAPSTGVRGLIDQQIRRPVPVSGAVLTQTIVHAGGVTWTLTHFIDNALTVTTVVAGGDAGATDLAAKAAIEAAFPVGTVVVINGTGDLSITLPVGIAFAVFSEVSSGGGSISTVESTPSEALPTFTLIVRDEVTSPLRTAAPVQGDADGPTPGTAILTADGTGHQIEWAVPAVAGETYTNGAAVVVEANSASLNWGLPIATASATTLPFAGPKWIGLDPHNPLFAHFSW